MNKTGTAPRLMYTFFVCVFLVIIGSIFSIFNIHVAKRNIISIYNDRVLPLEQLNEVTDAYTIGVIAYSQKAFNHKIDWDSAANGIEMAVLTIDSNWVLYQKTYLTSEEKFIINQAAPLKNKADQTIKEVIKILKSARSSQSEMALQQVVVNNLYPDIEPFIQKIDQLIILQTKEADNLKSLVERIFVRIITIASLAILMGAFIIFLIQYKNRLEKLVRSQANELAEAYDELNCANEELQTNNEELDAANQEYLMINDQLNIVNEELQKHKNEMELIVAERLKDLMESEERYRTLVENIMHPVLVSTFEGQLLFVNQIGAAFFGIQTADLQPYTYSNFWVDLSHRQRFVESLKIHGFVRDEEIELKNLAGNISTVILSSTIINNYYGKKAIFSVFNDITERKKMQDALIESEIKLNTVIESTNDFVWVVDPVEFKITMFNSAAKKGLMQIGRTIEIGSSIEDIIHESMVSVWYNIYKKVIETGKYEMEYVTVVGNRIFDCSLHLLKRGNKKMGISLFGRDITEKKNAEMELRKSEETFRIMFEQAGIGIALVDMEGRPVKNNPKLQEMLGYTSDELSGMSFTQFTHPDDSSKDFNLYSELVKGNIQFYQIEKRFIRKNGEIVWANLVASMVRSPEGLPLYGIGMVEDMTEKKEMERQILTNVIKTEENERLHFSQELHDGLGPLISAIKMYIQLLDMPNSKMQLSDIIMNVEKLIDEASESIREISFKLSPHILINYGIVEALKAFIEKVKESNKIAVELQSENVCRLPETIEIIIYRVICECINNTLKYAKASQINLSINCQQNELEVVYHDDGIGFNIEEVTKEYNGIGLMNMQSRIKSIDGNIQIDSKKGQGTSIRIKIKIPIVSN